MIKYKNIIKLSKIYYDIINNDFNEIMQSNLFEQS